MGLKKYQQDVITGLSLFPDQVQGTKYVYAAFHNFWTRYPKDTASTNAWQSH
jgi:hypothetical protein